MNDPRPEAESGAAEPRTSPTRSRVRCVTVLPPHREEPAALRAAMGRRGVAMTCYRSVYEALLGVIAESEHGPVALVFVDSGAFEDAQADRLVAALERRVERFTAWCFDAEGDGPPRLLPFVVAEPLDEYGPDDAPTAWEPAAVEGPRLRLAGFHDDEDEDGQDPECSDAAEEDEAEPGESLSDEAPGSLAEMLTSEEIAMLLDDLPHDDGIEESKA